MYAKLFTRILDSSIWLESDETLRVWITLLAAMDRDGFASFASVGNLAHRARVSVDDTRAAVSILESPDEDSSDPSHDGRRIERVPGGWLVLNAKKYRNLRDDRDRRDQTREAVRRHRADVSRGKPDVADVSRGKPRKAHAEAEADTEADAQCLSTPDGVRASDPNDTSCAKARRSPRRVPASPVVDVPVSLASSPVFMAAWGDWLEYRRRRRLSREPMFLSSKLSEFAGWGADRAAAAIRTSIANGWQGVFEPKVDVAGTIDLGDADRMLTEVDRLIREGKVP